MPIEHPKFIALDISTNTGYAIFDKGVLLKYDVFTSKVAGYKADVKCFSDFPKEYPYNFIATAKIIATECLRVIKENDIHYAIIEHPEAAKQRLSQRILEWTHYELALQLQAAKIDFKYLLVHDWRKQVGCYIKLWPEHGKWNKLVRDAKKIATPTKSGAMIAKLDGKVVSAVNQKKLSIIIANEKYSIAIKNDNIADAINLGRAAIELNAFAEFE